MWPYYLDLLAKPVPRYTSFPTAAEFGDAAGPADFATAIDSIGEGEAISLYLHIPYCSALCWYCGCNTGATYRFRRIRSYLDRLGDEIDLVGAAIDGRARVGRIAWGGGSPNAIPASAFERLMQRIGTAFRLDDPVVSVEIDPRGFTPEWAAALASNNVSRVSLGVQTFSPPIQAAIGRVQPTAMIVDVVAQLRGAGVSSLNFDLMYGLPGQTIATLAETLDTAIDLAPDRLAIFGYAHVPDVVPRQRRIDDRALPDGFGRFAQASFAHEWVTRSGYHPVGFDHFALPGDTIARAARARTLRRNFQGFTEDPADILIGLGASAISSFPGWLLQNEKNSGRYQQLIASGQFATTRGLARSGDDQRIATAIEQLLCRGSADLADLPGLDLVEEQLAPFVAKHLARWDGTVLRLEPDALPYARAIAATLDPYRRESAKQFSSAI